MPILYDCSTAPSPRRARILLAEKGVAHETVQIDLRSGEQLGDAYRAINPQCTVPALDTTFSSIITLPMSLAPKRSPTCPTCGPIVTQLAPIEWTLSR